MAASSPLAFGAKNIPIGLELYSVRDDLKKDLNGTVTAVAKMGYQVVEFFAPYYAWTTQETKDVRKLLDDLGIQCDSTHNDAKNFLPENLAKTAEMNHILGAKYVIMASSGRPQGVAGWTHVAETLNHADDAWKSSGLHPGYHNHQTEFTRGLLDNPQERPIDLIAAKRITTSFCNSTSAPVSRLAPTPSPG